MKYKVIINGYGSQITIGSIPKNFYDYWTKEGDPELLDSRLFPAFDQDGITDDNYREKLDSDDPLDIGMWKHHNDILSICNPFIDYLHFRVYDEQENMVWATDTINPVFSRIVNSNELGPGHYLKCAFDKKGKFVELYIDTPEWNPKKLKFHSKTIDGIEYLDRILYEGKMRKTIEDDSQRHASEDNRRYFFLKNT